MIISNFSKNYILIVKIGKKTGKIFIFNKQTPKTNFLIINK